MLFYFKIFLSNDVKVYNKITQTTHPCSFGQQQRPKTPKETNSWSNAFFGRRIRSPNTTCSLVSGFGQKSSSCHDIHPGRKCYLPAPLFFCLVYCKCSLTTIVFRFKMEAMYPLPALHVLKNMTVSTT